MTENEAKLAKEKAWESYREAKSRYNEILSKKYLEKYLGQYIVWYDIDEGEPQYMYVYNIWPSKTSDGIDVLYFEGVYFQGVYTDMADYTWFNWTQFCQHKFSISDFNPDTLEYKGYYSNPGQMKIISKEEFMRAFQDLVNKMINEHTEFDYEKDNPRNDAEG